MKKVARQPMRSSSSTIAGVEAGSGPSSKVTATWSARPFPTSLGVTRIAIGETPARAGPACSAPAAPAKPAAASAAVTAALSAAP
jgi:hypothetical protein